MLLFAQTFIRTNIIKYSNCYILVIKLGKKFQEIFVKKYKVKNSWSKNDAIKKKKKCNAKEQNNWHKNCLII